MRFVAVLLFSVAALPAADNCRSPIGIPCSTIRYQHSQWILRGLLPTHWGTAWTVAVRQDGSSASAWVTRAEMYLAPVDEVIRIDHDQRTVSHRPPIIWHDRPYRNSKDGDAVCATGILHSGTDFRLIGDSVVAGTPVKKWERGDGLYWREEVDLAPSLDCAALRHSEVRRNWALLPVFISSFEAVSVTLGAPEAALFAVPADYREVKDPTEDRLRAFIARNGRRGR